MNRREEKRGMVGCFREEEEEVVIKFEEMVDGEIRTRVLIQLLATLGGCTWAHTWAAFQNTQLR